MAMGKSTSRGATTDTSISTGGLIDERSRTVQKSGDSLYSNLTSLGAKYHNVDDGDAVTVRVCEHGIWISFGDTDE